MKKSFFYENKLLLFVVAKFGVKQQFKKNQNQLTFKYAWRFVL